MKIEVWSLSLLLLIPLGLLSAQDRAVPAPDAQAESNQAESKLKAAWKKVVQAGKVKPLPRADWGNQEKVLKWRAERAKAQKKMAQAAQAFLKEYADLLKEGKGLYYKGLALGAVGKREEAVRLFQEFRKKYPKAPEALDAGMQILFFYYGNNKYDKAKALLEKLTVEDLSGKYARILAQIRKRLSGNSYKMWKKRQSLIGKPLPEIPVLDVVGAKDFDWKKLKGKVLVLDFWATWCGPCRMVIPHLIRLQEEFGKKGLQVVGVTTYYGFAWELTERKGDTLIGKSAGRVSKERELELNKIFHEKGKLNYPIVLTERTVGREKFGVTGIPTLFVVDRKGKVRYYKVGSGNEEALRKEVEKLLKEK